MNDQVSFPGAAGARVCIADLKSGQTVDGVYACSEKTAATDRNGKAYLRLKLRDASGEVAGIHFDPSDEALGIAAGDVVVVGGTYSVHPQYGSQVQVRRLRLAEPEEYDAGDLVPVSPVGTAELAERLHALIDSVQEAHVRALLERAFDGSREPGATFAVAPAAVRNHHAYRHGLLEHSIVVAEVAGGAASQFASVDRDLVVAGGLLHDIGKTLAYTSGGFAPQMTDVGRLHGEIVMGHDMVRDLIDEDPEFSPELALRLRHIVVSHHGMREKGSPVVPQTREAVLVHYCDDMTARIAAIDDAETATPVGERWSSRIFMIDAPAYIGQRGEPGDDPDG
jgi:3'-5' exoribonuclease